MQFERLKKSHKKQIIIGSIAICVIGGTLTFATSRAFYRVDDSIDLAKGTVNYKAYDSKIIAMYKSEDGTNYTEIADRMPTSGYIINEEKSYCTIDNKTHDTEVRLYTKNRKHIFENLAKNDKCYLYFDKKANVDNGSELLAKMQSEANTTTPDFSKAATTDEGIFIADDPMYGTNAKTYYWRGATTTNYVIFANKCWRILRINGDGTFRLIYDGIPAGTSCSINDDYAISGTDSFIYNSTANYSAYVGWTYTNESQRPTNNNSATSSNLKLKAELWYNLNIASNKEFALQVVDGKYCNDRNVASGYVWSNRDTSSRFYYATYSRINTFSPTLSCSNEDIYTLKVGLITSDEVMYAGGTADKNNKTFYLYNAYGYWTMSPWGSNTGSAGMYFLNSSGSLAPRNLALEAYIRPVINLKDDITFSSGNGTQTNPYIVAD